MTFQEAKKIFIDRGYIEVDGGTIYDPDKWREACKVISDWLETKSVDGLIEVVEKKKRYGKDAFGTSSHFRFYNKGIDAAIEAVKKYCEVQ